jgi:hypothetical protein
MKELDLDQMNSIKGGNGWTCAGAVLGSLAVTAGATAIVAGSAGAGTALAVFLIAKSASLFTMVGSCYDI